MKYPAARNYLNEKCRPAPQGMRAKQVCDCEICGKVMAKSHAEVDHIIPAGSITDFSEIEGFVRRLFCSMDGYQLLCEECHDIKTYADRFGCTFEEAKIEKLVVAFKKLKAPLQKKLLVEKGFNEDELKSPKDREQLYRSYVIEQFPES